MSIDKAKNYIEKLDLKTDQNGLIPAIIQDVENGDVLMLAYMNLDSFAISLTEGRTCFWSRSRQTLWRKGETSGHRQIIKSISIDCDRDTIVIKVNQIGSACHNGTRTCFTKPVKFNEEVFE